VVFELEKRIAPKSPYYMAKFIMGHTQRRNNQLWGWNKHHLQASRLLWWAYRTRLERPWGTIVYLEWCRGVRKSTLLQATVGCYLLDDPNMTWLLDSDIMVKATEKSKAIRDLFDSTAFVDRWGSRRSKGNWKAEQWTLTRDVNSPDATLKASGLDASKTGGHFDGILCDDAQTDDNCKNPRINEQVKENFKMYETLKSGKVGTMTIVAGTRWGFNDLGAELQRMADEEVRRGVQRSIFIVRRGAYSMVEGHRSYQGYPQFSECGLTDEALKRLKMRMTPSQFSFNFLLQPVAEEEALIKREWIRHHNKSLEDFDVSKTRFFLAIDPAGEGKFKGADFTAMVLIGVTQQSEIFVMEVVNEHLAKLEMFNRIAMLSQMYPLMGVVIETYFEQFQLASWLKSKAQAALLTIPWMKFRPSKLSKEQRIAALQPYFQSGKIFWRKEHTQLEDQALQYPRSEHDDILDALASALHHASVPGQQVSGPWYMDPAWKDNGAFQPSQAFPEPPSDTMVKVLRAREMDKRLRTQRHKSRFTFLGMR
jgi:predicted phage terminase large subunit-like protein